MPKDAAKLPENIEITLGAPGETTQVMGRRMKDGQVVAAADFPDFRVRAMMKNRLARATDKKPDMGQKKVAPPKGKAAAPENKAGDEKK